MASPAHLAHDAATPSDSVVPTAVSGNSTLTTIKHHRAPVIFILKQFPAVLRHLITFLTNRRIKHVQPKHQYAWLFDNFAVRSSSVEAGSPLDASLSDDSLNSETLLRLMDKEDDPWRTEYTAAFFQRDSGKRLTEGVAMICNELNVAEGSLAQDRLQSRLQHFIDPVLQNHTIHSSAGKGVRHMHGPSSPSGISTTVATIPSFIAKSTSVINTFPGTKPSQGFLSGTTIFAEPNGWGIISDIDDTIKVTLTPQPLGLLSTTFLESPRPVPGMPALYAKLNNLLSCPTFFYISASPYNLYPLLRDFKSAHYPPGQIMLRENTWQSLPSLLSGLLADVKDYKLDRITHAHSLFPRRKFVLIGDATQKDPETYAQIARQWPDWVLMVLIRRVRGVSEVACPGLEEKNSGRRLERAFEGVDRGVWMAFDSPDGLEEVVAERMKAIGRADSVLEV